MPLYSTGCVMQGHINAELIAATQTSKPWRQYVLAPGSLDVSEEYSGDDNKLANTTSRSFLPPSYLSSLSRPALGSVPYGQVIDTCAVPGTLALTFDDGPWQYTSDLLDLLDREGARATFFVCGGNMVDDQLTSYGYPELLRRMLASGHQVGSHTWAHADLAGLPDAEVRQQVWLNEQALVDVLGFLPTYLRPPYLSWSDATLDVMAALGYHVASLDVDTRDWEGDYDAAQQTFIDALAGGESRIVLAHDIREQTVHELAEFMIDEARARGYQLVTLGECLGDDSENWYRNPHDGLSWKSGAGEEMRHHSRGWDERRAVSVEAEAEVDHHHTVSSTPLRVAS